MFFRYQRGSRSLAANLAMSQSAAVSAAVTTEGETQEQEEEDYDIPEEVETVIGPVQFAVSECLLFQFLCSEHWMCD